VQKAVCLILILSLLLGSPVLAATKSIGKDKVNLRTGPGLDYSIIFQAPLGYPVHIKCEKGKWLNLVDWYGNKGWVYRPLVSDVKTAVVLVVNANIRCAPSTADKVVKTAHRGEIYRVLDERSKWVKVGYYHEGTPIGWIQSDLVFGE